MDEPCTCQYQQCVELPPHYHYDCYIYLVNTGKPMLHSQGPFAKDRGKPMRVCHA